MASSTKVAIGSAVLSVASIGTAEIALAQSSASGCLSAGGQLSRVQVGEQPRGGECPNNQQEVRLLLEEQGTGRIVVHEEVATGPFSGSVIGDPRVGIRRVG